MKKYLIPAAVIVAFSAPALAQQSFPYYLAIQKGAQYGACEVMAQEPNPETHRKLGGYKSEAEAKAAMPTMKECGVPSPGQ
jgi:hypothetical protein